MQDIITVQMHTINTMSDLGKKICTVINKHFAHPPKLNDITVTLQKLDNNTVHLLAIHVKDTTIKLS